MYHFPSLCLYALCYSQTPLKTWDKPRNFLLLHHWGAMFRDLELLTLKQLPAFLFSLCFILSSSDFAETGPILFLYIFSTRLGVWTYVHTPNKWSSLTCRKWELYRYKCEVCTLDNLSKDQVFIYNSRPTGFVKKQAGVLSRRRRPVRVANMVNDNVLKTHVPIKTNCLSLYA